MRPVALDPFYIDIDPVTNAEFHEFIQAANYRTDSERLGWSFVFQGHIAKEDYQKLVCSTVSAASWWCKVNHTDWRHPEGPDSTLDGRSDYPSPTFPGTTQSPTASGLANASHRSRMGVCRAWRSRAETLSLGNELTPDGGHLCNVWQGEFPLLDLAEDGYSGTCPVTAFPPNAFGLYSMTGNTWEWCSDWFDPQYHVTATRTNPIGPPTGTSKAIKGGSYLCHRSYCNRYRVAARTSNTPDSATTNMGFRCVRDTI